MASREVRLLGIRTFGPEEFCCALLHVVGQRRVIPVWMTPSTARSLARRTAGAGPRRPEALELLAETIGESAQGIARINVGSAHRGVFYTDIELGDGTQLDAKISDGLALSALVGTPVTVAEEVIAATSVYVPRDEELELLGVEIPEDSSVAEAEQETASASGDAQADADFEALMRDMGVSETDLWGQEPPTEGE
ncbi:DUF151 domain-containing protein [Corynebacterium uberis]|uniref:bifunctional nuclease family protein n=1 Tax=Corynebacterium TaxID=1716 RepID=UPI001D0BCA23|nr:bifunctional nuclease domain-containing protein [Corynebacterium uberis]MCZ9308699.1 DUF151 domain-containing protein [Corynebacterium sp. c6VSa_13]UDL76829.1 DUF151 domain-containing protein [Corynebacterium uberis]UDL79042.1 DUF151 domain-containing protein [Corynebacterium uberis]UDL79280.1 DUF151 domain-containing protein [Corynebacterium uberis]UDL85664.1 DUF151 domain-containing protein [Corynebacterium uberis]